MITFNLFITMLRIRVSMILVIFFLIGAFNSKYCHELNLKLIIGAIALIISYGSATCFNDLADVEADKINLKGTKDRLLANNKVKKEKLIFLGLFCGFLSIIISIYLGLIPFILMFLIFLININYSLPPIRISFRTELVPFFLSLGYSLIPFFIGYFSFNNNISSSEIILAIGLYLLFIARISLKDFRDRKGDRAVGKKTILLKYGKNIVLLISSLSLILGTILLLIGSKANFSISISIILVLLMSSFFLFNLFRSTKLEDELLSIGLAARFGNASLILILGYFIFLNTKEVSNLNIYIFEILIVAVYLTQFLIFIKSPKYYKYGGGGWMPTKD